MDLRSRAFHYGDGLFESIRVIDGAPLLPRCPLGETDRKCEGVAHQDAPWSWTGPRSNAFSSTYRPIGIKSGRGRLTVYRDATGHYRPEGNEGAFTIELHPMPDASYTLNDQGLTVDIYPEMRKPVNVLAVHKTLNCQFYIMASLWSRERSLDDCLLQNDRGNIIESSNGNLFIVSNGVLYTPSLSDGCVGGVMRMQVINLALANGIKVYECSLNPQNLLAADELFFTNAIRGIQWVGTYRTKRYTHRMSTTLVDLLAEKALS